MAKKKKPAAPPVLAMGITCADAAALLNCSKTHVSYLIQTGELTAQRVGGRFLLVDPASVVEYNANPKRRDRSKDKIIHPVTIKSKKSPSKKKTAARKMDVLHPGLVKIKRKKKATGVSAAVKKAVKKTAAKKKAKKKTRRNVRV